jgi:hemolysin activation/secretion protein
LNNGKHFIRRKTIFRGHFKQTMPVLCAVFFVYSPLYAQVNVERATSEVDSLSRDEEKLQRRLRPLQQKSVEIKTEEAAASKKEEEQAFFVKTINLIGCESVSPEIFSSRIAKYENREVTLTELNILAKDIEQEYLKQGIIAAIFVPPQDIKEGNVTFQVVEAKMGELKIQKHKYFSKKRLSYYWEIPEGKALRYDKISKSLKMMNKNPDREVKSTLVAGKKPGTTDVVLTPETNFPVHFLSSYDKEGVTSSGKSRYTFGMRHNNFLGLDDMLLTGYTFGQHFSGKYAYHNIPVSPFGTSLIYGYSQSESMPKKEFAPFGIKSTAKNISLSLYQDLYRKDNYLGEVYSTFDAKDKTIIMNTGTYNRDRLRVFRLGGNLNLRGVNSVTYISPEVSQGVEAFGASPHNNALASRGAKASFNKFILSLQQRRNLPLNLQANFKIKSQFSHQKLTPQEEFSLGGINSVRGYPSDDYLADNAVLASAELLIPAFFIPQSWRIPYAGESVRNQTTAVAFFDYGHGSRIQPTAGEKKSKDLLGVGAGLRFRLLNQATLRLEYGFPLADNHPITESGRSRFHFAVDFQDMLPEELERIIKEMEKNEIQRIALQLVNDELTKENSPVREKMESVLIEAREYNRLGKLNEAREAYSKMLELAKSLYQQSEDYVGGAFEKEDQLKGYRKHAITLSKLGQLEEAKKEWGKIIKEGLETQPLNLSFQ